MTIDDRVKEFAQFFKDSAAWDVFLKSAMQELVRDQCIACARSTECSESSRIYQAILNAKIK